MKRRALKLSFEQRFGVPADLIIRRWDDLQPQLARRQTQVLALWATHPNANAKTIAKELDITINSACLTARNIKNKLDRIRRGCGTPPYMRPAIEKMELAEADASLIDAISDRIPRTTRPYLLAAISHPKAKVGEIASMVNRSVESASAAIRRIRTVGRTVQAGRDTQTEAGNE